MQPNRLLKQSHTKHTIEVSDVDQVEFEVYESDVVVTSYSMWSEAFQAWIKQDYAYLCKHYASKEELVNQKIWAYLQNDYT